MISTDTNGGRGAGGAADEGLHDGAPRKLFGKDFTLPPEFADSLAHKSTGIDEYDERIAYLSSIVSAWSYADRGTLERMLAYYGMPGADVECVTVRNDPMLIVATAYLVRS